MTALTNLYGYAYHGMRKQIEGGWVNDYGTLFRPYEGGLGRWSSQDPIMRSWATPYEGMGSSPTMLIDPLGLEPTGGGGYADRPSSVEMGGGGGSGTTSSGVAQTMTTTGSSQAADAKAPQMAPVVPFIDFLRPHESMDPATRDFLRRISPPSWMTSNLPGMAPPKEEIGPSDEDAIRRTFRYAEDWYSSPSEGIGEQGAKSAAKLGVGILNGLTFTSQTMGGSNQPKKLSGRPANSTDLVLTVMPAPVAMAGGMAGAGNKVAALESSSTQRAAAGAKGTTAAKVAPLAEAGPVVSTAQRNGTITLYRAVEAKELADIQATGQFRSVPGIESKYFSTNLEGAQKFADMMTAQFGNRFGPYTIVKTEVPSSILKVKFPPFG